MKCPRCQHENRSGVKFCEECATPLAQKLRGVKFTGETQ